MRIKRRSRKSFVSLPALVPAVSARPARAAVPPSNTFSIHSMIPKDLISNSIDSAAVSSKLNALLHK